MISSGVLLPNIFVIIILHVQCLSILNYPIFLTKQSQGMAQPWSWELAATLSWEMLSFWVKMVMVPLIYIHLQTNCSWIWLGFVHLFSCVSQCQGCFSYDRDVANCTATLKQTGRSRRSSHEARKICKGDHVLYWCNKGTVPMGWFLDWERTTFFLIPFDSIGQVFVRFLVHSQMVYPGLRIWYALRWLQILAVTVVSCFAKASILYSNCSWYWDIIKTNITYHRKRCRHGDTWSWIFFNSCPRSTYMRYESLWFPSMDDILVQDHGVYQCAQWWRATSVIS